MLTHYVQTNRLSAVVKALTMSAFTVPRCRYLH